MTRRAKAPVLLVFAKEPLPGSVKTRLATTIGNERACAVYRELTALTLMHATQAHGARIIGNIELWCASDPRTPYFSALAAAHGASLHRQANGDLGARMADAIDSALTRAPAVLLVGTDCPVLDCGYLARACAALADHDAVLGPAADGGYVAVGARRPLPFGAIRWSTPHALADTAAGFTRAGIAWSELPATWDVDDAQDLARWNALRDASTTGSP
ncbi:MAG: TIGR04282 family arsenosugar biosynthesis glycosyltransferase [Burkholderiales bacterium]|nr:TIGR04282 family arsenosugar biosynthesis glycosyltransferase [Burkholderiales bacterium]